MKRCMLALVVGLMAINCSDDSPPSVGVNSSSFTKGEAAQNDGLTSDGQDACEIMGWYTDGVCDEFCPVTDDACADVGPTACGGQDAVDCPDGQFCSFPLSAECGNVDPIGTCEIQAGNCTNDVNPVCGCDGMTYGNACYAARSGVNVAAMGACEGTCLIPSDCGEQVCDQGVCVDACTTSDDCGEEFCTEGLCGPALTVCNETITCSVGDFCYLGTQDACGAADGMCQTIPEVCTDDVAPVCGCDNVTYINPCAAAAAGSNVASLGECPRVCAKDAECLSGEVCENAICVPGPGSCGGRIGDTCAADQFCNIPDGCGFADETGTCTDIPLACPDVYLPVCGCTGMTYGNDCEAAAAGISIASTGECPRACTKDLECNRGEVCTDMLCVLPTSPVTCGGRTGGVCNATQWCDYGGPINACGAADGTGTCEPRPQVCPLVFIPVCGCDNNNYGNACEAHAAGVDIVSTGTCPVTM